MRSSSVLAASAAVAAVLAAGGAQAAVFLDDTSSHAAAQATDTSFDLQFVAPSAGAAALSFTLLGFGSLDGDNYYEDDFTLSLNGAAVLSGTWTLGGGGDDAVFFAPDGSTFDKSGGAVAWKGGQVNISTPLELAEGANTLTFSYVARPYNHAANGGFQGIGDEGWGAADILLASNASSSDFALVPEPMSWILMLAGFGGAGLMLRRRGMPHGATPAFATI
jgi:hypothetical protein